MKLLAIYAHPNSPSLNRSILEVIEREADAKGHELKVRDLYALGFNAVLSANELHQGDGKVAEDVREEQEFVNWADILIFIYPIWWYGQPAILKGWIDRVFTLGFAYGPTPNGIKGLLKQSKALIFQTAGASEEKYQELKGHLNIEETISFGALKYCGIENTDVQTFYSVFSRPQGQMNEIFEQVQKCISSI